MFDSFSHWVAFMLYLEFFDTDNKQSFKNFFLTIFPTSLKFTQKGMVIYYSLIIYS